MRKNILLVDDDKDIQELVSFYLDQAGYVTKCVSDGYSALASIQSDHYDLMILDISMPHINGFKVLRTLRDMEKYSNFPVLMLTGSGEKSDFERVRDKVSDYVIKPPVREDLLNRVERILGCRPQFEELHFGKQDPLAQGELAIPLRLVSMSHQGVVISSPIMITKNVAFETLKLKLFAELKIEHQHFKFIDCVRKSNGTYECFISFLGMGLEDQEVIHRWLMSKVFADKTGVI